MRKFLKIGALILRVVSVPVPRDKTRSGRESDGHKCRHSQRANRTGLFLLRPPSWKLPIFGILTVSKSLHSQQVLVVYN